MISAAVAAIVAVLGLVLALWPRPGSRRTHHAPAQSGFLAPMTLPSIEAIEPAARAQLVSPREIGQRTVRDGAAPIFMPATVVDLFEGPAPEIIGKGHQIVVDGRALHPKRLKELYDFGKAHPGDARPYLVMAMDSMNRGWYGLAAGHYARAAKEDPRAKYDPNVMEDLVIIAGRQHDFDKAQTALADLYGSTALPAVEAAIQEASSAGDTAKVERLQNFRAVLEKLPQR